MLRGRVGKTLAVWRGGIGYLAVFSPVDTVRSARCSASAPKCAYMCRPRTALRVRGDAWKESRGRRVRFAVRALPRERHSGSERARAAAADGGVACCATTVRARIESDAA